MRRENKGRTFKKRKRLFNDDQVRGARNLEASQSAFSIGKIYFLAEPLLDLEKWYIHGMI
jgi:hypothetical protein